MYGGCYLLGNIVQRGDHGRDPCGAHIGGCEYQLHWRMFKLGGRVGAFSDPIDLYDRDMDHEKSVLRPP